MPRPRRRSPKSPAPGVAVVSYPTPNINDSIYIEVVDATNGQYEPLVYGTHFNDVAHSAFPNDLPDHILVYDELADASGDYRKRIWVNNRADQDAYNAEVTYDSGDANYPTYVRTYVMLRSEYVPLAELTPDPVDAGAFLIVEKRINEVQPPELFGQYIKVVRIYSTLPGKVSTSKAYNERGDLETTTSQDVVAGTEPDADGLLVTKSGTQNTDTATVLKKIKSTVASYVQLITKSKGGLELIPAKFRVNTQVNETDDIVAPDTNPDVIADGVVESVVKQQSATKANKITRSVAGALLSALQSLSGKEVTTQFGGDTLNVTQTPVADGTSPDAGYLVVDSSVEPTGLGVSLKTTKQAVSWPTLVEYQFDPRIEAFLKIEKTVVSAVGIAPTYDTTNHLLIEHQQIDKWRSVQIQSKYNSAVVGTSKVKKIGVKYSFPAWVWQVAFVTAYTSDVDRLSVALRVDMIPGPTGTFVGTLTETVVTNPNTNDTPYIFYETGGVIALAYSHGDPTNPKAVEASTWTIPPSLHAGITPSLGSFTNVASTVTGVLASNPTSPPSGSVIITDVGMEKWRLDLHIKSVITLTVPNYS